MFFEFLKNFIRFLLQSCCRICQKWKLKNTQSIVIPRESKSRTGNKLNAKFILANKASLKLLIFSNSFSSRNLFEIMEERRRYLRFDIWNTCTIYKVFNQFEEILPKVRCD
ncbi:UNVERIFIED_CONTAM: hypothetical protein RMT77_007768 [Armadillidium vulgare]